jgi:hypothetical protein
VSIKNGGNRDNRKGAYGTRIGGGHLRYQDAIMSIKNCGN